MVQKHYRQERPKHNSICFHSGNLNANDAVYSCWSSKKKVARTEQDDHMSSHEMDKGQSIDNQRFLRDLKKPATKIRSVFGCQADWRKTDRIFVWTVLQRRNQIKTSLTTDDEKEVT